MTGKKAPCVVIYSYKGGTGKTLTTVQMGAALATLGRKVCLVDFDLEAPGLGVAIPTLLGISGISDREAMRSLGLVDYIHEFAVVAKDRGWLRTCDACGSMVPTRLLPKQEELATTLLSVSSKASFRSWGSKGGGIFWISAGQLLSTLGPEPYWEKLHSRPVQAVIENNDWSAPFFRALLDRIRQDLEVDYIIVDSRSGFNELSGTCTRALADKLVILTGLQEEGIYGTSHLLRILEQARSNKERYKYCGPELHDIFLVASRVPEIVLESSGKPVTIRRDDPNLERSIAQYNWDHRRGWLRGRLSEELRHELDRGVLILASAPNLEWEQRIPLPGSILPPLPARVTIDYVDLLVAVFGEAEPSMREELQPYTKRLYILRPYFLNEETGTIVNPEDGAENVAFTVSTYVATLESMCDSLRMQVKSSPKPPSAQEIDRTVDDALLKAGMHAARKFSEYLAKVRFARRKKTKDGLWDEVREWCRFDSNVGFGRFEASPYGPRGEEGRIVVYDNFLVRNRSAKAQNLCPFMAGYISQILTAIYEPHQVEVTHDVKNSCGLGRPLLESGDPQPCEFAYTVVWAADESAKGA